MPRRCGLCRQEGHDRRTCPNRPRENNRIQERNILTIVSNRDEMREQLGLPRIIGRAVTDVGDGVYHYRERLDNGDFIVFYSRRFLPPIARPVWIPSPFTRPSTPPPRPQTPPKIKKQIPKHIAGQVWELNKPDCIICLDEIKKDDYVLSVCGHNYCNKCFNDDRLDKCGECRQSIV